MRSVIEGVAVITAAASLGGFVAYMFGWSVPLVMFYSGWLIGLPYIVQMSNDISFYYYKKRRIAEMLSSGDPKYNWLSD